MMIKIAAIICTHNPREDFLRRVLGGLRGQTLSFDSWELLLVDNGSRVPVTERFDLSWHPNARHIHESELGLTPARLRGIEESKADILVFVDDDTVLATDYLEQALTVAKQWPFVGAWGGSVIPEYECPLPKWVGNQVWRLTVVEVREDVWSNLREGFATMPCGAGLCFRRSVGLAYAERCQILRSAASFDRKGGELTGYGDIDLAHSALDIGFGTGKSKRLQLTHLIPKNRLTLDYFVRHAEDDASSMILFRASRCLPISSPKPLSFLYRVRWLVHCIKNRVPREQYEIQKAHYRGLQKGYALAQKKFPRSP